MTMISVVVLMRDRLLLTRRAVHPYANTWGFGSAPFFGLWLNMKC